MSEGKPLPMPLRTREILRAIYLFRQRNQRPQDTERWWRRCIDEMAVINRQFENDAFCRELLAACFRDIERELKGERRL